MFSIYICGKIVAHSWRKLSPKGIFHNVCRHFWFHIWRSGVLLSPNGWGQRCCSTSSNNTWGHPASRKKLLAGNIVVQLPDIKVNYS